MPSSRDALRGFKSFFSTCLSTLCIFIIAYGIGNGHAALEGNPAVLFIVLAADLTLLAYLEGLQVAILALERIRVDAYADRYPRALKVHAYSTRGNNVQRFLVGRQAFVIGTVFILAQCTTYPTLPDMGLPRWLFVALIETGLPGALVVLAFGQLMPQLLAAHAPVWFMNLPGAHTVVSIALGLESSGVTQFSWLITDVAKRAVSLAYEQHDVEAEQPMLPKEPRYWDADLTVDADESVLQGFAEAGIAEAGGGARKAVELRLMEEKEDVEAGRRTSVDAWGFTPEGFPRPQQLVSRLLADGRPVPRFLLPPSHEQHVPPHIVAYHLMEQLAAARSAAGDNSSAMADAGDDDFEFFTELDIEADALRKAAEYRRLYRSWRVGKAAGAKGEVQAVVSSSSSSGGSVSGDLAGRDD